MGDTDTALTDMDMLLLTPTGITAIMAMDTEDTVVDTADTVDMATDITVTMARGLLMLSPDMAIMAMDTEDTVVDTMVMVMVMATDTTVEKFQKFMLIPSD